MIVASASALTLYSSGRVKYLRLFLRYWWPLTYWRLSSDTFLISSASCTMMSELGLSQKPVGIYSAKAQRRRDNRLALSAWMLSVCTSLAAVVGCDLVSKRKRQMPARRPYASARNEYMVQGSPRAPPHTLTIMILPAAMMTPK